MAAFAAPFACCSTGVVLAGALLACASGARSSAPAAPAAPVDSSEPAPPRDRPADLYHPAPRDTVDVPLYQAWQQYSLQCARCHGQDGQGTSFGPSLLRALGPEGDVTTRETFLDVLTHGRPDQGMPSAGKMGLDPVYFEGLYAYLKGRSDGRLHGGRPARRER